MNPAAEILYEACSKLELHRLYHVADICYCLATYVNGDITLNNCKLNIDIILNSILNKEKEDNKKWEIHCCDQYVPNKVILDE